MALARWCLAVGAGESGDKNRACNRVLGRKVLVQTALRTVVNSAAPSAIRVPPACTNRLMSSQSPEMAISLSQRTLKSGASDGRLAKCDLVPVVRAKHCILAIDQNHRSANLICSAT